jgi:hypothetical protein
VCVCILALVKQQAMRTRRIILSSVASLAPPYFFPNGRVLEKKLLNTKCVFSLQFVSETSIILRRIQQDAVINVTFRKTPQILNFMKIRPVGAKLMHAESHEAKIRQE